MPNFQNQLVLAISADENNPITFSKPAPEASPVLTLGKYSKGQVRTTTAPATTAPVTTTPATTETATTAPVTNSPSTRIALFTRRVLLPTPTVPMPSHTRNTTLPPVQVLTSESQATTISTPATR